MKKTVIIYARQSIGDEVKSESVEDQINSCRKLAEKNDWQVLEIFKDLDQSGSTYPVGSESFAASDRRWLAYCKDNKHVGQKPFRAGFGQALAALRRQHVDYILAYDSTRIMRPIKRSHLSEYIKNEIEETGALCWTIHEGLCDWNVFETDLVSNIREKVEADIKEKLRIRSKKLLREMKDRGGAVAPTCYGYRYIRATQVVPAHAEIIPDEAALVREVYDKFKTMTVSAIYRELLLRGLRTWKKNGQLNRRSLIRLLKSPWYIGKTLDTSGALIDSLIYPPIVDKEVWLATQEKLSKVKRYKVRSTKTPHPLAGLVFCNHCGEKLQIRKRASTHYYYSCNHSSDVGIPPEIAKGCNKTAIIEHTSYKFDLEGRRMAPVLGVLDSVYPLAIIAFDKMRKDMLLQGKVVDKRLELQNELDRLGVKEADLNGKWLKEEITNESHSDLSKAIKTRKEAIRVELSNLVLVSDRKIAFNILDLMNRIESAELTDQELFNLMHDALKRIDVYYRHIEVTLYDGVRIRLERIQSGSARACPAWIRTRQDIQDGGYDRTVISYLYRSYYGGDRTEHVLYDAPGMLIKSIGVNKWKRPEPKA